MDSSNFRPYAFLASKMIDKNYTMDQIRDFIEFLEDKSGRGAHS